MWPERQSFPPVRRPDEFVSHENVRVHYIHYAATRPLDIWLVAMFG
jgi:hypothetical protein